MKKFQQKKSIFNALLDQLWFSLTVRAAHLKASYESTPKPFDTIQEEDEEDSISANSETPILKNLPKKLSEDLDRRASVILEETSKHLNLRPETAGRAKPFMVIRYYSLFSEEH